MISIFSVSKLSSNPSQAVSTIRFNVFQRLDPKEFVYWTTVDSEEFTLGSVKKIPVTSKNKYIQFLEKIYWMYRLKPDILLFTGDPFELFFYFLRPRSVKVVLHLNGPMPPSLRVYPFRTWRYSFLWHSLVFLIRHADRIVTVSRYAARTIEAFSPHGAVDIIYNGVDLLAFVPGKRNRVYLVQKYHIDFSKPTILFVGILNRRKRPDIVMEVAKRCPDFNFIFIGQKTGEIELFSGNQPPLNVSWFPSASREDIAIFFASVDIFLFPALWEGFGMVFAEAMASGLPVIATRQGGAADELFCDGESGILTDIGYKDVEVAAIINAINRIIHNPALAKKMSVAARLRAQSMFNWDIIAKQWKICLTSIP